MGHFDHINETSELFFFWIPRGRWTIFCYFQENWNNFIFFFYPWIWLLTLELLSHLTSETPVAFEKYLVIYFFFEFLNQRDWFDTLCINIQSLLFFDHLMTPWDHFKASYFKMLNDTSVASVGAYVRTCRRIRNSNKIASIHDYFV